MVVVLEIPAIAADSGSLGSTTVLIVSLSAPIAGGVDLHVLVLAEQLLTVQEYTVCTMLMSQRET